MTQNTSIHRSVATLKLPRRVSALVSYVLSVVRAMTGNQNFPGPVPALADVSAAVAALQAAETAVLSGLKGTAVVRNDRKAALVILMGELRSYVQKVADADPENGAAIIQSAGLAVRKPRVDKPRVFSANAGRVSGSVEVIAVAAARRASYEWEYSTDAGKTWIAAAPSLQAKTTIAGLPVAAYVQLRYRAITKAGPADWSQPLTFVVE